MEGGHGYNFPADETDDYENTYWKRVSKTRIGSILFYIFLGLISSNYLEFSDIPKNYPKLFRFPEIYRFPGNFLESGSPGYFKNSKTEILKIWCSVYC